jgi:mevalonate pyrophosphate decarboxylase
MPTNTKIKPVQTATSLINEKEIKEFFEDWVEYNEMKINKKKNFDDFLRFLEIDLYDWLKENLRCYFRD